MPPGSAPAPSVGAAVAAIRSGTADDHAAVDARFGGFDLSDPGAYGRFLRAHALALPGIEAALLGRAGLPPLRPRAVLLAADIAALGQAMPTAMPCPAPADDAAAFGMAYVIEGSRLGGAMIARTLPPSLPAAYLSAAHLRGEWRGFLVAFEAAAGDAAWVARAAAAARATFARYVAAAEIVSPAG